MSKPAYWISAEATLDLNSILDYTAGQWSVEQAERYYFELIDGFQFLAENPLAGKPAERFRKGYRIFLIHSHVIFYQTTNEGKIIIVRVLHETMDAKEHFR